MSEMVELKRTTEDKQAEKARYEEPIGATEEYPYGLRLSLGQEELEKLNISQLNVGDMLTMTARVKVTEFSDRTTEQGKDLRAELEVQAMDLQVPDVDPKKALYPGDTK